MIQTLLIVIMKHEFVESIPSSIDENVIYISIQYSTALHKCACGCGNEVVTPLSPTDWKLTFDGESVSLSPSIGNWEFPCQSHYWIKRNRVEWAGQWSKKEIEEGRQQDLAIKEEKYEDASQVTEKVLVEEGEVKKRRWWLFRLFF